MYTDDFQKKENYLNLKNTIVINVIDCEEYHSTFKIFEEHRQELLTDKFRIDFLELRKAKEFKERGSMTDKKQMWMDFLNANAEDDETLERLASDSPIMQKAVHDEISARAYERQQGIAQGVEQGKQDLISKMKKSGMSDEQIQKILAIK